MRTADSMRQDWDERARKDAFFYIASWREDWDEAAFFQSGEEDYQRLVAGVLEKRAFVPQDKKMLEIGCGVGRMTRTFAKNFQTVTAIDLSSEMLDRAQILNAAVRNITWTRGNGTDLQPLADRSVDFVFSYLVFQHLPQKELVLRYIAEMSRVLTPRGLCLFQFNGASHSNMNWRGRVVWSLLDALWLLRFRALVGMASKIFGLDPDMAGANWHGVAVTAGDIMAAVRAADGEAIEVLGENSPMAWCCARKGAGDTSGAQA
jgi:ubiquinone/menaquinone biosynthesis C-methylase UbiE